MQLFVGWAVGWPGARRERHQRGAAAPLAVLVAIGPRGRVARAHAWSWATRAITR